MNAPNIEHLLATKRRELELYLERRQFGPEFSVLTDEVLELERVLAEQRGEPHVVEWSPPTGESWDGNEFATIIGDAFSCALIFTTNARTYAVLGFRKAIAYKVTDVGEETIDGHPMTGKGLTSYRAFLVKNSLWVRELEAIDRIHPQHIAGKWHTCYHYLFSFRHRMVEAIASEAQLVGTFTSPDQAVQRALAYSNGRG